MLIKRSIKRAAQHACAALGPHRWPTHSATLLVLMYHRILPQEDNRYLGEQPGMIVEPATFRMHLETLKQYFEPIHLGEWIHRTNNGQPLPDKAFSITFDDGWRDNYDYAYEHLKAEQVPATIFLVSDYVGTSETFWPERLMKTIIISHKEHGPATWDIKAFQWIKHLNAVYGFDDRPPNRDELDDIVTRAKRFPDKELHNKIDGMQACISMDNNLGAADILDWEQVNEMVDSNLIDIGSHTRRHIRMTSSLEDSVIENEIIESRHILESRINKKVDLFCYPNGDISQKAANLVRQHYKGACTTASGWNKAGCDSHLIKRIGIHQDIATDKTAFLGRLSGWL